MSQFIIIAVDGPTASGKGTLARRLAEQFHFFYLDTGAVYRAVGKYILDTGGNLDDPEFALKGAIYIRDNLSWDILNDPALRTDSVADAASRSSKFPAMREVLLDTQRLYASHPPLMESKNKTFQGSVLDGRDIGTVVCPHADVKLYVTADVETRAERRFKELSGKGIPTTYETVLQDMMDRDARDSGRAIAPLIPAKDAIIFDTSKLNADEALASAADIIRAKLA